MQQSLIKVVQCYEDGKLWSQILSTNSVRYGDFWTKAPGDTGCLCYDPFLKDVLVRMWRYGNDFQVWECIGKDQMELPTNGRLMTHELGLSQDDLNQWWSNRIESEVLKDNLRLFPHEFRGWSRYAVAFKEIKLVKRLF